MVRILIIFYCISLIFFTSQTNKVNGEVIYKFKPNLISKEEKNKSKELYDVIDILNKSSKNISFKLTFNENESFFDINNVLDLDLESRSVSYAKNIITKGKYYKNTKKDELLVESNFSDENTLIKSKPSNIKWKIHKETKKIDTFLCTKATTTKIVTNSKGKKAFEIVAWFTSSIPVKHGPVEFSGLPGLILELKSNLHTFYADEIKLLDSYKTVQNLDSKNVITKE